MINYDLKKIKALVFDAIQLAVKRGLHVAIITGGNTEAVRKRYEGLGVTDLYMGSNIKLMAYDDFKQKYGLNDNEVLYMGDDIPDLEVLMLSCRCLS